MMKAVLTITIPSIFRFLLIETGVKSARRGDCTFSMENREMVHLPQFLFVQQSIEKL
jgi:hypothetical protein